MQARSQHGSSSTQHRLLHPIAQHIPSHDAERRGDDERVRAGISFATHSESDFLAVALPSFGRGDDLASIRTAGERASLGRGVGFGSFGTLLAEKPAAVKTRRDEQNAADGTHDGSLARP